MKDQTIGAQARLMSKALRKITGSLNKNKTTIIFINQVREKVGIIFGSHSSDLVQGFTSKHHLKKTAHDKHAFCRMLGYHVFRNCPFGYMGCKHAYRTITLYNWHRFYSSHAGSWGKKNTCH